MLAGEFERKVRSLNSRLRIYCSNDDSKPAGMFHVVDGEYTELMGVDKNYLPEFVRYGVSNTIEKRGWRSVIERLIHAGLVSKSKAEKVFNTHFDGRKADVPVLDQDPILKALDWNKEKPFSRLDIHDLAEESRNANRRNPN
jgi:hypothetical protein